MIKIYKTFAGYQEIDEVQKDCWVNVTAPDALDIKELYSKFNLPEEIVTDTLDQDERSRIEYDDDWTLIIIRVPIKNQREGLPFLTVPLGIYITDNFTLTLCLEDNEVLPSKPIYRTRQSFLDTRDSYHFATSLFVISANLYLKYLKQINQITATIEQDLEQSIKNRELNQLLKMEKCLVYFITSIKGNEITLARIKNSRKIPIEIDEDLLEDALVENKQALEMAQIYSDIQAGMMDAFASVISNNLNVVMKQLTLISLILMIPTLIVSTFGMNVPNYMETATWAMPAIIGTGVLLSIIGVVLFRKRHWF